MKKAVFFVLLCASAWLHAAETLKIDFRYNTRADDGKNHLYWQTKDTKTKDSFDAVTGASRATSTKLLRAVQTENKKKTFPKGLYALLLFAVSPQAQAETDALTVTAAGAHLALSFVHRGNAYRIATDEKGLLNTRTSFTMAEGLADNVAGVFTVKEAYATGAEGENATENAGAPPAEIDWNKVVFEPDDYDESAEAIWDGTLRTTFADGVLTITGKLKKIAPPEKPKPADAEAENEDEAEATGGVTGDVPPLEGVAENGSEADG